MSRTPLVSILIPVYNVQDYLRECLDSLVGQTLTDIEIVCVNDGSTDDSPRILEEYAARDDRIVIVNKKNGGLPSARNAGLDVARGEYVGFVDADDYVDVDMFRKMYNYAAANRFEVVVCGGHCFPEDEPAPHWMTEALSPKDLQYTNSDIHTFYKEIGARPFLWRDMVKRELVERYSLRLDESVVLGEDVAFQYKLFSYAKRVGFLSDKLYHYRWKRPNSIMEGLNYKDHSLRLKKHLYMLESVALFESKLKPDADKIVLFNEWAVSFIYWDLVRLSFNSRVEIARIFSGLLRDLDFYTYYDKYNNDTKRFVQYIEDIALLPQRKNPALTVVLVLNGCASYMNGFLDSLAAQSMADYDLVIYENGADPVTMGIVWDYFFRDQRISIRLGEWQPLCTHYNDAISLLSSDFVMFVNGFDIVKDGDFFKNAVETFAADPEVDLFGQSDYAEEGKSDSRNCELSKYRNFIYKTERIREWKLAFRDYSILTGSVFFTEYMLKANAVYSTPNVISHNIPLRRQNIYAEEAKIMLRAMKRLLTLARENGLEKLGYRVTEMLNSEDYVRLITDATYGFYMDPSALTNPKEDFHREVLESLIMCNSLAFLRETDRAVLRSLSAFIEKRHRFLEKM